MHAHRGWSDPSTPTPPNGTPTPATPIRPAPPRHVFHDHEAPRGLRRWLVLMVVALAVAALVAFWVADVVPAVR